MIGMAAFHKEAFDDALRVADKLNVRVELGVDALAQLDEILSFDRNHRI